MKELNSNDRLQEKQSIEQIQEKKKQVEYTLDDSIKPREGHTLFEIDLSTLEIKEAKYKIEHTVHLYQALSSKKEVIKNNGCVYVSALNAKSALKRLKNNKGSAKIPKGYMKLKTLNS